MSDNDVTLVGNLTRDPELRYTTNGTAVVDLGLAVNKRVKRGDEWEDESHFFDVTAWDQLAENISESLRKGNRVIVTGALQFRSWEKDGAKHSKVSVTATAVGPDLRWATADVTRVGGGQREDSGAPYSPDEEPF